jgi:hypothetical protein
MPDTPEFSSDEEEIRQKQEEFRNVVEEHKKLHPGGALGINTGNDPIAREAMIRLMGNTLTLAALATRFIPRCGSPQCWVHPSQ